MRTKTHLGLAAGAAALLWAGGAAAQEQLFFYNWSNYFPPELLEKFQAETGIAVTLDIYDSNESMLAKLQAGGAGYDVVVPSDYIVPVMIEEGLLQEIDVLSMANAGNLAPPHDDSSFDPGRKYTAPYMWGTTGVTYDSAKVEGEVDDSWSLVFEPPESVSGHIAMLNDQVEVWNAAAYYLGIDKCTESADDAARILALLEAQEPHVALYNSDGTIERMIAGEVIVHHQWNGASHRTREGLPTAVYVYPKEGLTFWVDNFAVPADAPNPENARTFINWMMEPENIAAASNFTGYMNGIKGSDAFLDPALADDPAVNMPAELADRLRPSKTCSTEALELRDRVWTRLKS
jgi:spermidine/putrescine transport system substrate-binding protein